MQQMVPGQGVEPGSAAARTKPLHIGRLLYQLSEMVPQPLLVLSSPTLLHCICCRLFFSNSPAPFLQCSSCLGLEDGIVAMATSLGNAHP